MEIPRLRRPRVALYSHDAVGLGHVRRNLAIAAALRGMNPAPDVLLVTGTPEAAALDRPDGCDVLGLPALAKDDDGTYGARHLSFSVGELVAMRAETIRCALEAFRPDLLVVDKHPRGFRGELTPALDLLARRGTRVVLGLRDVLDEPARARREWQDDRSSEAVLRWYDRVWLYGDPRVHDAVTALRLPAGVARLVTYTGYLARRVPPAPTPPTDPYVLGLVGAGSDGGPLAEAFAAARLPEGHLGALVTGPQLPPAPAAAVDELASARDDLRVHEFVPDVVPWLDGAAAVVAMGGYNTVCETMASGRPLLVVPRVRPRAEQLVRAVGLAGVGALDVLHPDDLSPLRVGDWLAHAVRTPVHARGQVDLDGLDRLPELAARLLRSGTRRAGTEAADVA